MTTQTARKLTDVGLSSACAARDLSLRQPADSLNLGNDCRPVHSGDQCIANGITRASAAAIVQRHAVHLIAGSGSVADVTTTFGDRVREARTRRGLSQAELARLAGIAQPTLAQMETGRNEGSKKVALLAAVLGVNPVWLTTGRGPRDSNDVASSISGVPLIEWDELDNINIALASQKQRVHVVASMRSGPNSFALVVQVDSMQPLIPQRATIIVDPDAEVRSGDVVVARVDGDAIVRTILREGSTTYLRAANERYPMLKLDVSAGDAILGRVVALQASL